MKNNRFIHLFASCIAVKGATRAIICDLQRYLFIPVPHSLVNLFNRNGLLDAIAYESKLDQEGKIIFKEYIDLLVKYELIFYCTKEEAKHFPKLSMEWDYPSQITNCIIDISAFSNHDYAHILNTELDAVNCRYVEFRHFSDSSIAFWQYLMEIINKNEIKAIDIIMKDCPDEFTHETFANWVSQNRKIRCVTLHSSLENKEIQKPDYGFSGVFSIIENLSNNLHCGVIHHAYFSINIESFTESQHHNTCLNRKISIDINGQIKNCPSMAKSYGNIRDTKLLDVVNDPEFQKVWHIKKDEITKCKDCEFRHICTDCRAYIENPNDIYSAPLKCGYNPYTCEWEEWSTNPLKQQAIDYYGMREIL